MTDNIQMLPVYHSHKKRGRPANKCRMEGRNNIPEQSSELKV